MNILDHKYQIAWKDKPFCDLCKKTANQKWAFHSLKVFTCEEHGKFGMEFIEHKIDLYEKNQATEDLLSK
jgi:hypothetical protein